MIALSTPSDASWTPYLEAFHTERAGITEQILAQCDHDGIDPYDWAAQPLAGQPGPVLDVACGNAPMADRVPTWAGTDTSDAELAAARARRRGPLVRASATRLPIATGRVPAAVCSMSMQILTPVTEAFAELGRVLRPGAVAVLLLPADRPMPWRHAITYLRLQGALRTRIRYPNDHALAPERLSPALAAVGLAVRSDERLPFSLRLGSEDDVDALLRSLYLPGVDPGRLDAGRRVMAGQIGGVLTVPLRRVAVERAGTAG